MIERFFARGKAVVKEYAVKLGFSVKRQYGKAAVVHIAAVRKFKAHRFEQPKLCTFLYRAAHVIVVFAVFKVYVKTFIAFVPIFFDKNAKTAAHRVFRILERCVV